MIGNKQQNTNSNLSKHQFIATTCLGPNKMSTTTALKAHSHHQHHHTAAMAPSFEHNNNNNSKASMTMSSLAADLCKAAAAVKQSPPMEAVVVNSIIYSKPSFCSIVVDIGGRGNTTSTMAASCSGPTAAKFVGATKDNEISEQIPTNRTQQKETTWATTDKTFAPFANDGYFPLATTTPATAARTNAHNLPEDEAHVYMMCTTMNGSVHHHISELCDNLISMGLFGMTNSEHDDDSLIEFAYDDDDDLNQTDDHDNEDEDEEDEDEDEDEVETETEDEDCEDDVDDYCLYDDGEDVVDFVRTCPIEKAPNEFYCDKKKKV